MLDRALDVEYLPYCKRNNIAVLAYSPLANGLLTGKVDPDRVFPEDDLRHQNPLYTRESRIRVNGMLDQMHEVAQKHELTIGQLVIAWTIAQPGLTHALVGARDTAQAAENAAAAVTLPAGDLANIGEALGNTASRKAA